MFIFSEDCKVEGYIQKQSSGTLLKKRLWHRCFPVNFAKFLGTIFFTEHLWWMRLYIATLDVTTDRRKYNLNGNGRKNTGKHHQENTKSTFML